MTELEYQREIDSVEKKKENIQNVKQLTPELPLHPLPQHPSHFKPTPFHPSITSILLSSAAFKGTGISRSPLDNKLTAVENGFFQFGCSQSHYVVIGEPYDCVPVWWLVRGEEPRHSSRQLRGRCAKRKLGGDT